MHNLLSQDAMEANSIAQFKKELDEFMEDRSLCLLKAGRNVTYGL